MRVPLITRKAQQILANRRAIKALRREFSFLGYDLSEFSDEEIFDASHRIQNAASDVGFSVEDAASTFAKLAQASPTMPPPRWLARSRRRAR